jgi:SAM-dependent methyltransferase
MNTTQAKHIFDSLYASINGYYVSMNAKRKLAYTDKTLTYGEVLFESFSEILHDAVPRTGEIFYDLGSGTGKAVLIANLLFPFSKTVGIELLKDINDVALEVAKRFDSEFKQVVSVEKKLPKLHYIQGDFLSYDFSDADIIFSHCTCHPDELMRVFSKWCDELLKIGARVVTVTKPLFSENFRLIKSKDYKMGWGEGTVLFYEKVK